MLFGTAYYHEYQPFERLDADIELMRAAAMNYVRVGESTWSLWEPREGEFRFDWLERVVDRCHAAGIASIIGTPTYAIPAWLARRYPEILAHPQFGHSLQFGTRQNVNISHAAYRFHAERVIREVVGHFAQHPGVIGWQVDNETGVHLLHNPDVNRRFIDHLKTKYGSISELNAAWGTTHWSLSLEDWADLWPDANNSSPGYDLDWRRFQSGLTTEFLAWQRDIVRSLARPEQFITHCSVGGHALIRPAVDSRAVARVVDIPAVNPYYTTQATLTLPDPHGYEQRSAWHPGTGVWAVYLQADMARADAATGFLVLETNASNAGYPHENYPAWQGQWHQVALALAARGARGIGYWHWHSCHAGKEIYWRGILGHDHQPGRCYEEISRIGAELAQSGALFDRAIPDVDVAFLLSKDSEYGLSFLPPLADPVTNDALRDAYARIFNVFYRGYFDAGLQAAVVDPDAELLLDGRPRWPLLCVPAAYIMDQGLADRLIAYASAGGHLVLTFRTAYADQHGRARHSTAPGPLADAAGLRYRDFTNLREPVRVRSASPAELEVDGATASDWADMVEADTADTLLYYDTEQLAKYSAATTNVCGAGRVTWIGTLPDPVLARRIATWSAAACGLSSEWSGLPESVRMDSATLPDGLRLTLVANWSGRPTTVVLPIGALDTRSDRSLGAGTELKLGPRESALLLIGAPADARAKDLPTTTTHKQPLAGYARTT